MQIRGIPFFTRFPILFMKMIDLSIANYLLVIDLIEGKVSSTSSEISKNLTADLIQRLTYIENVSKTNRQSLERLREDADKLSKLLMDINTNLVAMQLEFNLSDIALSELAGRSKNIVDYVNDVDSYANSQLQAIENSASSRNDSYTAGLARTTIDNLKNKTGVLRNETNRLNELVTNAVSKLNSLNTNLANARTAKTEALNSVSLAQELLKEMQATIDEIDKNTAEIINQIAGIQIKDPSLISQPITTTIKPVVKEKSHLSNILPTLIVLIIMITAVLLSSTLVVADKRSKAFFRNYLTPTSNFIFNLGTYLSSLIVIALQLLLFMIIASYAFGVSGFANFWVTILILFFIISLFITIGMLIGLIFKTEETNTLASITAASLMLFFSGIVLPLESMPSYIQTITRLNPFNISELLLKQSIFFGYNLSQVFFTLLVLVEYFIGIFVLMLVIQYFTRKNIFHWHIKRK